VRISRRTLLAAVSSVVALGILVGGFFLLTGGSGKDQPGPANSTAASGPLYSPFTGERVSTLRRELIFKIDNVPQARPPTGLTKADIVYLLPVDGGLSRIMAVFSSHIPPVVGPVRSSREEDIKLLRQFGRPAFAFSGAQPHLLPVVEHARIVDLYDGIVGGYFRDNSRVAPYNLYAKTGELLREAKGASKARDIGFRFGAAPAGGTPTSVYNVSYPAAAFSFRWSASQHRCRGRRRAAGRAHHRGPVHQGPHVGVPRTGSQAAVRRDRRQRQRGRAARRPRVPRALVAAQRQRRHHVHVARRSPDAVRQGAGVGRVRLRAWLDEVIRRIR
jgi:hypothetical protein